MIYVTHHNSKTFAIVGTSVDSGFNSVDDVIESMPIDYDSRTSRRVTYHVTDTDSLTFSNFAFEI
jgi:hypothetical protein